MAGRPRKAKVEEDPKLEEKIEEALKDPAPLTPEKPGEKTISIKQEDWDKVQDQLRMLYEVADKARVMNYESQRQGGKKPIKVRLSVFAGKIMTGWRTIKDELVKHPTTGLTVGEVQEYEVILLNKDNTITKATISGYKQFSDARYTERVEGEVIGKKETWDGSMTLDVQLADGRVVQIDSRFIN